MENIRDMENYIFCFFIRSFLTNTRSHKAMNKQKRKCKMIDDRVGGRTTNIIYTVVHDTKIQSIRRYFRKLSMFRITLIINSISKRRIICFVLKICILPFDLPLRVYLIVSPGIL